MRHSGSFTTKLAMAIARKVIGDAVELRPEVVQSAVHRALQLVKARERVTVFVHPEDLDNVRAAEADWLAQLERARSLQFEADGRLKRGGCRIETEFGEVTAEIDQQIATLENALGLGDV